MGFDYVLVHVTYNIPLAGLLTLVYWPFMTRLDWQKISTLVIISLVATIPWDSHLVRHRIWTYAPNGVTGWTLYDIPIEEVSFFIFQTYNTSLVYLILTRRLVLPMYLGKVARKETIIGALILLLATLVGLIALRCGEQFTYIGLIMTWAGPFLLIQWLFSSGFIMALPRMELMASVTLPTLFLWTVDTISINKGTWTVEVPTKLGIQPWSGMDIEEVLFFLVTNMMIVFGLVCIDHAIAMATCELAQSSEAVQSLPSYFRVFAQFMTNRYHPDARFVVSLGNAVERLAASSQSLYMGSAMFQGPLRIDLILLYSFFRIADDLVDEAQDTDSARRVIEQCDQLLEAKFSHPELFPFSPSSEEAKHPALPELIAAINSLPVSRLRLEHLKGLLEGFRTDLAFDAKSGSFPIVTESDLDAYSYHVASTVAASMLGLVVHHFPDHQFAVNVFLRRRVVDAGERMGQALQYTNVARDIARDAAMNRVYLPTTWLKEQGLSPADVLASPTDARLQLVRNKALDRADFLGASAREEIRLLPEEVQGPFFATVDSYLEIGAALRRGMRPGTSGAS
ncbi:phytoene synthase [Aspergillus bombycis]|uniref:Bifunctional lycopene cyclase/phytoene synthase n=1 Tax=Aspergillus bombycis TaxID=109264 RepID=A0A1F8A969_9EURO|nr:phytoene synthase [Aspergillus bombycis]OGM47838.1 phytoene synthase [Aspergillus bombycis]